MQEEEECRQALANARALFEKGFYKCSICRLIKRLSTFALNSRSSSHPCCSTCWPAVSLCVQKGFDVHKFRPLLQSFSFNSLLTTEMNELRKGAQQMEQPEVHVQFPGFRKCELCGQSIDKIKSIVTQLQISGPTWESNNTLPVLESFCASCRFDPPSRFTDCLNWLFSKPASASVQCTTKALRVARQCTVQFACFRIAHVQCQGCILSTCTCVAEARTQRVCTVRQCADTPAAVST